ncbi:SDR family oxidoreductase [Anoxybacterium hadale]|uniref:SDR family oxidoreductase n=1 Tax=Anoxybacterium hadale TaxID=3408580 RepID=A0ACD1A8W0_9FIRM|nr:SDR family oxidoreductase [Clostridiales bacterium]
MGIKGKNVLITGGTSGFGKATAYLMLSQGANVIITGRKEDTLKQAVSELGKVDSFCADVAKPSDWMNLYEYIQTKYGKLDILVNNAGSGIVVKELADQTLEEIHQCVETNLMGCIYGIHYFAPMLKEQGGGTIINVSSVCARHSWPGYSVYAAAKAGVLSLSKSAYVELQKDRVRVTCVIPGAGATNFQINAQESPMAQSPDNLKAEDMAAAICNICALPDHVVVEEITVWGMSQVVSPL